PDWGRGSYVDTWSRTNFFAPFVPVFDSEVAPPLSRLEEKTYKLVLEEVEDPLQKCFFSLECGHYHGEEGVFCSSHARSTFGIGKNELLSLIKWYLKMNIATLRVQNATLVSPPKGIEVEYAREDDPDLKFDN